MNDIIKMLDEYEANKPKKARKPPYRKPQSVKDLEEKLFELKKQKYVDSPYLVKHKLRDDTANGLTKCICAWLKVNGYFGARTNTTGIYNAKLGRYIHSGSTKGQADINAVVGGRSIQIEIKIGKDKPRAEQLKVAEQVRNAGGQYLFIKSFDDFLGQIKPLTVF